MNEKDLAEFIGIMLGDGYFSDNRLKVSFNSVTDLEYIYYVKKLMLGLFNENAILKFRKEENTAELYLFKRSILKTLNDNGLIKSPKWQRAIIPTSFLKFDLAVLRGYFDTDGCVVITDNNGTIYPRLEMKICPSPMQEQFIRILGKYQFNFGVYNIGKGEVRIQLNGEKQLDKWLNLVGFSNKKHLDKVQLFIK